MACSQIGSQSDAIRQPPACRVTVKRGSSNPRTTMRARRAPGVLDASSAVSAKSVTVRVRYAGPDAAAAENAIRRAVAAELAALLADPPSPTIRLERSKEARR